MSFGLVNAFEFRACIDPVSSANRILGNASNTSLEAHVSIRCSDFFKNILPEGTPPVDLVLDSTCGQRTLTYQITGRTVKLISSHEDVHDGHFEDMIVLGEIDQFGGDGYGDWAERQQAGH